jgi:hypothetical protein
MDPSQRQFKPRDALRPPLNPELWRLFLWDPGGKPLKCLVNGQVC